MYKEAVTALEEHLGQALAARWEACDSTMQVYSDHLKVLESLRGDTWEWHDDVFASEGLRTWASAADGAGSTGEEPAATQQMDDTQQEETDKGAATPVL